MLLDPVCHSGPWPQIRWAAEAFPNSSAIPVKHPPDRLRLPAPNALTRGRCRLPLVGPQAKRQDLERPL